MDWKMAAETRFTGKESRNEYLRNENPGNRKANISIEKKVKL